MLHWAHPSRRIHRSIAGSPSLTGIPHAPLQVTRPAGRVFGLDVLRAFAIICVVYEHGYGLTHHAIAKKTYFLFVFDGVTMFFVLSGFLIGCILLRMLDQPGLHRGMLVEFWVRRWFRTIPNYLLVLGLLVLANALSGQPQPDGLAGYFLFSQNLASPHPDFFPEAWSLSVEEWFYLVIPIPLYLSAKLKRFDRHHLTLFWIAAILLAVTAFRVYRAQHFGYDNFNDWDDALRKQVLTRLDSLMFGVLGAYLSLYRTRLWQRSATPALIAGLTLLLFDKLYYTNTASIAYLNFFSLTLTAVGTLLLLPKLSTLTRTSGWLVRAITTISLISYSMYLLNYTPVQHIILPALMRNLMPWLGGWDEHIIVIGYALYWLVTLACAYLLYRFFERPMTALRERWPGRGGVTVLVGREAQAGI